MLTKHYIAIDTKETNIDGEKLLLPISPPYKSLRGLGNAIGIVNLRHLYKMASGEIKSNKNNVAIEIVYIEGEECDEEVCTKD
jgi:hypothetical protein